MEKKRYEIKMLLELIKLIFKEKFASITWQLIVLSFVVLILPGVPLVYLFDRVTFFEANVVKIIFLTMGFCFLVFFFNFIFVDLYLLKSLKSKINEYNNLKEKFLIGESTLAMAMSVAPIYFPLIIVYINNLGVRIFSVLVIITNVLLVLFLIILNNYGERHETLTKVEQNNESL